MIKVTVYYNVYLRNNGGYWFGVHWATKEHAKIARSLKAHSRCVGIVEMSRVEQ